MQQDHAIAAVCRRWGSAFAYGALVVDHDHLTVMLNRLKLTAIRDQLDSLVDEAVRGELTVREAMSLFFEREIARKD
jgi:hypothetical protein